MYTDTASSNGQQRRRISNATNSALDEPLASFDRQTIIRDHAKNDDQHQAPIPGPIGPHTMPHGATRCTMEPNVATIWDMGSHMLLTVPHGAPQCTTVQLNHMGLNRLAN
eukprot:FR741103.1.p1 GENE.FR741103.1~~FR741103.1.p1  ORF type:complete len:110 (-),score=1.81 FR741103.1:313-642(-)